MNTQEKINNAINTYNSENEDTQSFEDKTIRILEEIADSHSHNIESIDDQDIIDAMNAINDNLTEADFNLDFDGNEYRLIHEDAIWNIYVDEIQQIVEDCYDLKLDKVPDFIALSIDWEKTAKNAYADGYGHTFSGYDGSEYEASGFYIFRTN